MSPLPARRFAAAANLAFSIASLIVTLITGFIMVPLYLRYFDVATYGAWLASGGLIIAIGVLDAGWGIVVSQKTASAIARSDMTTFADLCGSGVLGAVILGASIAVLGCGAAFIAPDWVKTPAPQRPSMVAGLVMAALGTGLATVHYTVGAIPQALQRTVVPGVLSVLAALATVGAILVGLHMGLGVAALGLGPLVTSLVFLLGYAIYVPQLWRTHQLPRCSFSRVTSGEIWLDARGLLAARITSAIGTQVEVPLAAIFVSPTAAAVLALTGRVISVVPMITDRVGSAVFAGLAHVSERPPAGRTAIVHEVVVTSTVLSGLGLSVAVAFSASLIALWVGPELYGGGLLLGAITCGCVTTIRYKLYSNLLIAFGQIRIAVPWMVVEVILRLAFLVFLSWLFSLVGLPVATALASAITAGLLGNLLITRVHIPSRLIWMPGLSTLLLLLGAAMAWQAWVHSPSTILGLCLQAIGFSAAVFVLSLLCDRIWRDTLRRNLVAVAQALGLTRWAADSGG